MEKLLSELLRLYLAPDAAAHERLERHLRGQEVLAVPDEDGATRAIAIPFEQPAEGGDAHWSALCELASVLQVRFGFPAPAVSISGASGYRLWVSLDTPVPAAEARQFVQLLGRAPGSGPEPLPPCLHPASGKWAAFINPGMGASFIEEPGLDFAPPLAAQAAFLEGLDSTSLTLFRQALRALAPAPQAAPSLAPQPGAATADGLLLRDATLEDIVRHLHRMNIEPTFRHLLPRAD